MEIPSTGIITFDKKSTDTYEIMSGVFYDVNIDPDLTSEVITDSLTIKSNQTDDDNQSMYVGLARNINGYLTPFSTGYPVTGIQDVNKSILVSPYCNWDKGYFTTDTGSVGTKTYKEQVVAITAMDSEGNESAAKSITLHAENNLPTFTCTFKNMSLETVSSVNLTTENNIFYVELSNIDDYEDGEDFLNGKSGSSILSYLKFVSTESAVNAILTSDRFNIAGCTRTLPSIVTLGVARIKYEVTDFTALSTIGSFDLKVGLYDKMGTRERIATPLDWETHKNVAVSSNRLRITVDGVDVDLVTEKEDSFNLGTLYAGVGSIEDTFTEADQTMETSSSNRTLLIPFEVTVPTANMNEVYLKVTCFNTGASPIYTVDATTEDELSIDVVYVGAEGETITAKKVSFLCTEGSSEYILLTPIVANETITISLHPKIKANWWGQFTLSMEIGVGENQTDGGESKSWDITITQPDSAPVLL